MPQDYWQRQTNQPLFPELEWSRPETKAQAGKLLIIGGHGQGFAAPAQAYQMAEQAGIGSARVLLPDALEKLVGHMLAAGEFAPSTPSGSFGRSSLDVFLDNAAWADGVLLAGELGHNSETAIVLETFVNKYHGQLTLTGDSLDYFLNNPASILDRPDTTLIISLGQLQKLFKASRETSAITSDIELFNLVESLHDFSGRHAANLVVKHQQTALVASAGQISTTPTGLDENEWPNIAAKASVWWLQNPSRSFEALTTSLV